MLLCPVYTPSFLITVALKHLSLNLLAPSGFHLTCQIPSLDERGAPRSSLGCRSARRGLRRRDSRAPGSTGHPLSPHGSSPGQARRPLTGEGRQRLALPRPRVAFRRRERKAARRPGLPRQTPPALSARSAGPPRTPGPTAPSEPSNHSATPENSRMCAGPPRFAPNPQIGPDGMPSLLGSAPGPAESPLGF